MRLQRLHACALRFLTSSTPHHCGSAPPFYPRDPLLPCGTWRHPCGALEAPRRRPCDALATPLRHLASLLAPHPLPAPSLPRRGGSLTLSLYLDCSASVAAPREAAPSMRVPVAILSARAMPATRDDHALRAHTGGVLRPSSTSRALRLI